MPQASAIDFTARVVPGRKRGRTIGTPTINLHLKDVPAELAQGIYACFTWLDDERKEAVMHYGPRPVYDDTISCEVHVPGEAIPDAPDALRIHVVAFIRDVTDFPLREVLQEQIKSDIKVAHAILSSPQQP
ncbi:MAG: riboflavin kinase [Candidatus Peribacteraceae bacterium]|nr:riboflavin kinase [Candidatus Peribacteraceae bacterium]